MSMQVAEASHEIARPLRVIEGLIKDELEQAEAAAQPYYTRIAPLLVEAREGHFQGNSAGFYEWATKKFGKSRERIRTYVALGSNAHAKSFKNLDHFTHSPKSQGGLGHAPRVTALRREWGAPVDEVAQRAQREAFLLAQQDALSYAQERDAQRQLAHRLIDIGYKVLAKELHPDKLNGDRDAMARLNKVRGKLKHAI